MVIIIAEKTLDSKFDLNSCSIDRKGHALCPSLYYSVIEFVLDINYSLQPEELRSKNIIIYDWPSQVKN